jgi:zinc/manganese transport system substrate-binding protein
VVGESVLDLLVDRGHGDRIVTILILNKDMDVRSRLLLMTVAAALVVAACGGASTEEDGLRVVVTTSVLGDVVRSVVEDAADVEVLLPLGADPHDFTPSSAQVAAMETADLVVINGLGLEHDLEDVLDAVADAGTAMLEVGPRVDPIGFAGTACEPEASEDPHGATDEEAGDAPEHDHEGCDPHIWMDPLRAAAAAEVVAEALSDLAPGDWEANADDYAAAMEATDAEIRAELSVVPADRRVLVTNHDSLGYFALRYDFEVIGTIVPGGSTLAEPSSRELAELVATMEAAGVDVVFAETTEPTTLADALAAELGDDAAVVELYTGSLGEPGSGAETLSGMLLTDARLIADALG